MKLLFVCMGNICRSPTAEGVMRRRVADAGLADRIIIDSAGTHAYHTGHEPDSRAQAHAGRRGYDLSLLRARQIGVADFHESDLVLAMDWENLALLEQACPPGARHRVRLLMQFASRHASQVVPDPYYGGAEGFETVLDYVEDACDGLLAHCLGRLAKAGGAAH